MTTWLPNAAAIVPPAPASRWTRMRCRHNTWLVTRARYSRCSGRLDYTGFYADYYLALFTTGVTELDETCTGCGKTRTGHWVEGRVTPAQLNAHRA